MKRTLAVISVSLGAFFVCNYVKAETVFQNNTSSSGYCWQHQDGVIVRPPCSPSNTGNSNTIVITQDMWAGSSVNISSITFYSNVAPGGTNRNAYIRTVTQYNSDANDPETGYLKKSSTCDNTTTSNCVFSGGYILTPSDLTPDGEYIIQYRVTSPIGNSYAPYLTPDQYPTFSSGQYSGNYIAHSYSDGVANHQVGGNYDWQFTLYNENNLLTITRPADGSSVFGNLNSSGTCTNSSFDVFVRRTNSSFNSQGEDYGTIFGVNPSCNSNVWQFSISSFATSSGFWKIHASSTSNMQTDTNVFFWTQQGTPTDTLAPDNFPLNQDIASTTSPIIPNFNCEIPYLTWDPCLAISDSINFVGTQVKMKVNQSWIGLNNTYPYAYPLKIYGAVRSGLEETNADSQSLPGLVIPFDMQGVNYNVNLSMTTSTTDHVFSESGWTTMRPYFKIPIYFGFIAYIVALII